MTVLPQQTPGFLGQPELHLLLFGGKGGVGKTTCAAASALALARRYSDRRFLAVSVDPAHSLQDCFVGPSPLANLDVVEIDAAASLLRFKTAHGVVLRQIAARGTLLDEEDINEVMELSLPGLDEIMAFQEIAEYLDTGRYATIIVDTAPTGHALRFLLVPSLLRQWLDTVDALLAKHRYLVRRYGGATRRDAMEQFLADLAGLTERLAALLQDHAHARFVPVMIAEDLSIEETRRLVAQLAELRVPVTDLLVNLLQPAGPLCPLCLDQRRRQEQGRQRIVATFADYALWGLPLQPVEVRGPGPLAQFWNAVAPLAAGTEPGPDPTDVPPRVDAPPPLPAPGTSLLLFAGKGGVGKTTLACAAALRLAAAYPARRVLIFSTDPAHSLADCLDLPGPVGHERPVGPGLTMLESDPAADLAAFKRGYQEEIAGFFSSLQSAGGLEVEFDQEALARVMDLAPPGLDEIMALTRVLDLMAGGSYDLFVLDTAPTGHLIRLLELPELIETWLKLFFRVLLKYRQLFRLPQTSAYLVTLSKRLKGLRALLADQQRAALYVVSILTELAYAETTDLVTACRRLGVAVPALLLNRVIASGDCAVCAPLAAGEARVGQHFATTFPDLPQARVYRCRDPRGRDRLRALGEQLFAADPAPAGSRHQGGPP